MDEKVKELYLAHHGIKGQKWGLRKYQNEDGTLTEEGRARYQKKLGKLEKKIAKWERKTEHYKKKEDSYASGLLRAGNNYARQSFKARNLRRHFPKQSEFHSKFAGTSLGAMEIYARRSRNYKIAAARGESKLNKLKKKYAKILSKLEHSEEMNPMADYLNRIEKVLENATEAERESILAEIDEMFDDEGELMLDGEDEDEDENESENENENESTDIDESSELAHFGILGQKWGVRRYQNEDRTYTEEGKLRYAKNHDGEPRREWKGKDAKDLSDKELRDRISRLQLEKAYTQLFEAPKVKNDGSQKQQKQKKKGEGVLKKIFFATAVTAMANIMQDKYKDKFSKWYDKVFKKKAKDAIKETAKDAAENVAKSAAKTAKKAAKTAADTIDWDTYLWQTFRHSDEEGLSFLDMKVGDLYLEHHGIKGQKWGVRRYQNEDGSLTEEGRARYSKDLDKRSHEVLTENFQLRDKYISILERNNSNNKADGEHEIQEISKKLSDNRKKLEEIDYEIAKRRENAYKETVAQEQDSRWIDPKYRKFSSKEEKAAAEEAYFERLEKEPADENDRDKWEREVSHMSNTVWNMSMNGYEGIPKSERQKKEHDYVDTSDPFDSYDNWRPKYENTEEWKDLQSQKESIRKSFGFSEILKSADKAKTFIGFWHIMDKYEKAQKECEKMTEGITKREKEIETEFRNKIMKNACLDLGYEPTDANLKYLEWWIWYD